MANLDVAIRERLEEFCSDWCAEAGKAVIHSLLELHKTNQSGDCSECLTGTADYEDEGHVRTPCPTLLAVAKGLGIEA